jgi:hypothetical protein
MISYVLFVFAGFVSGSSLHGDVAHVPECGVLRWILLRPVARGVCVLFF